MPYTKVAWIRDASVPVGEPAGGHYDCPCGHQVGAGPFGGQWTSTCQRCGRVFDGRGYIIIGASVPEDHGR